MNKENQTDQSFLPSVSFAWGELSPQDTELLEKVFADLEQGKGLISRISGLMGGSLNELVRIATDSLRLSPAAMETFQKIAQKALETAFDLASLGMEKTQEEVTSHFLTAFGGHAALAKGAIAFSGIAGGIGGLPAMIPDLTFSTLVIMREIAAIAREEGENLSDEGTRKACLEVFGLRSFAGKSKEDINFFAARALLRGQPLVYLIAEVAGHYGISLSRKTALQMVPVAGALCGAALNTAFLNHYRALARAHFTVRRLERTYGPVAADAAEMAAAFAGTAPKI